MKFIKRIGGALAIGAAMMFGLPASLAQAAYYLALHQQGNDVFAQGAGTIDLTDLVAEAVGVLASANMYPMLGGVLAGPTLAVADLNSGFAGPTSFGGGTSENASTGSGDILGVDSFHNLVAPDGYVSGHDLASFATWANQTFGSLGVTPGSYQWTWGSGAHADFFQLDLFEEAAAVPESSSVLLLALSLGLVVMLARLPGVNFDHTLRHLIVGTVFPNFSLLTS